MKRSFALLLFSLLLVCALTACGGERDSQTGSGENHAAADSTDRPGTDSAGGDLADAGDDLADAGRDVGRAMEDTGDAIGDAVTGGRTRGVSPARQKARIGVSLEEMLRNGQVLDRPGRSC